MSSKSLSSDHYAIFLLLWMLLTCFAASMLVSSEEAAPDSVFTCSPTLKTERNYTIIHTGLSAVNTFIYLPPATECGKVMFSVVSVRHSVCLQEGGVPMWPLPGSIQTCSPGECPSDPPSPHRDPRPAQPPNMCKLVHLDFTITGTYQTCSNLFT